MDIICTSQNCHKKYDRHPFVRVGLPKTHIFILPYTVKREMPVAIIFGSFKNITIWRRFNLEILLEGSGGVHIFFIC